VVVVVDLVTGFFVVSGVTVVVVVLVTGFFVVGSAATVVGFGLGLLVGLRVVTGSSGAPGVDGGRSHSG
jgi:hypothetical protein